MKVRFPNVPHVTALVLIGLALGFANVACGDDSDDHAATATSASTEGVATDVQAVEETIAQVFGPSDGDYDYFFDHVTDALIESLLGLTRGECQASPADCIGEPLPPSNFSDTAIDGDTATSTADFGDGLMHIALVAEDSVWKVDSVTFSAVSDAVPEGVTLVDLGLTEFAFELDPAAIPADGNVAFHVTNDGEQMHEVYVQQVPAEGPLRETFDEVHMFCDDKPQPCEGPPIAGVKADIQPGQVVDMAFDSPLASGRYAIVCFVADTSSEGEVSHIDRGMLAEFTVG